LPEPVPPQIPMIKGLLSSGGGFSDGMTHSFGAISQVEYLLRFLNVAASQSGYLRFDFPRFLSSISACAAASLATPTRNGDALT
jgi:hypothetical protein